MFCIVSWHHEVRDLCFWDGLSWGPSAGGAFFHTRKEAATAMRKVKAGAGTGFLKPNVLDVDAFNARFGKSIGPKPAIQVTVKADRRTGILERMEAHISPIR